MISGLLIDLDGTVYNQGRVYTGVSAALGDIDRRGIPYRFITNTTRRNRSQLATRLDNMGITTDPAHLFIAPQAAAIYCRKQGYRRIQLVTADQAVVEEFEGLTLTAEEPEALVLGDLGEDFTYPVLNSIFQVLMSGIVLIAMQKSRYWFTEEFGMTLDLGPYVAALEYATGKEAVVVGKPARDFYALAAESLGVPVDQIAVVGDSVENDVAGAQAAGLAGVLVRTGVFQEGEAERLGIRPVAVLDSLAHIPEWLDGI